MLFFLEFLTDKQKAKNDEAPADVVKNWLINKETISFLGVWEELNNENFKVVEFDHFKNEAKSHAFTVPSKMNQRNKCYWYYFK